MFSDTGAGSATEHQETLWSPKAKHIKMLSLRGRTIHSTPKRLAELDDLNRSFILVATLPEIYTAASSMSTFSPEISLKVRPAGLMLPIVRTDYEAVAEQNYIIAISVSIVIGAGYDDGWLDKNCGRRTDAGRTANATSYEIQISVGQNRKCLSHR